MKKLIFTDNDQGGIIQIANIKGGVGKSTIATNLAASLAARGQTLIIDLDVQGCATAALGKDPASFKKSSYNLFTKRYYLPETLMPHLNSRSIKGAIRNFTRRFFFGKDIITDLTVPVMPGLDLIPANASLFGRITKGKIRNFIFSLRVCREYYKYIIIDTASVWDDIVRTIFVNADLNLIPVTLNALSTKSLKEYINEIAKLLRKHPNVNVRIIKNEVYGTSSSLNKGKTRTMNENRSYLHSLFESFAAQSGDNETALPRSIVLNLEIPEASIIRSAQDSGLSVVQLRNIGSLRKSFEQLTDAVQFLLNRIHNAKPKKIDIKFEIDAYARIFLKAAVFLFAALFSLSTTEGKIPPVRTPAQLEKTEVAPIIHTFRSDESLYKVAKYAISEYRALIPNNIWLDKYIREIIQNHNLIARETRQPYINNAYTIPIGTEITLYPPSFLRNRNYQLDYRLFTYYKSLVKEEMPYITGLWANRGIGGGTPHEGVDIACPLGTVIICPSDGTARLEWSTRGGNTVCVYKDDYMLMFCHMDKRFVQHGEKIIKGQPIGTVGMTGVTSGPHLHFGYAIKSPRGRSYDFIDPNNWVFRQNFIQNELVKSE